MQQSSLNKFFSSTKKQKGEDGEAVATAVEGRVGGAIIIPPQPAEEELAKSTLYPLLQEEGWRAQLSPEFVKPYFKKLEEFVEAEYAKGKVFPPRERIFFALNETPLHKVRVVILGQDPYHAPGQAMGLSFSVPRGVKVPSSLYNIYKEIKSEMPEFVPPKHGDLTLWAERGLLLLNAALTVRQAEANSHANKGWELFTDRVIEVLGALDQPLVFLLWGQNAQQRAKKLPPKPSHLVLKSPHPSGLSAAKGFFGNGHFAKANEFLVAQGCPPFDWNLPN